MAGGREVFLLDRGQIDGRLESDAERIYSKHLQHAANPSSDFSDFSSSELG
jgi:hypothetical protein